jgi:ParB/RepB/Spo0J family partition protein
MLQIIQVELIDAPERVLRHDIRQEAVIELAESIRAIGLLQAIGVVVAGGRFRLVFGHRRLLAHRWLGRSVIEAQVLDASAAIELDSSVAENTVRADLSPVEEAHAVRALIDGRGRTVRQVALALGRSEGWVRARLTLLTWPVEILAPVASGLLPVSVAAELVGVEDDAMRAHFLSCVLASGCTAVQMRQWRLEYEVQRPMLGGRSPAEVAGEVPPRPPCIRVVCAVCFVEHSLADVQFLKVCGACQEVLRDTQRGAA